MELSPEEMAGVGYFRQENCISCHAVGGSGATIGPDLTKMAIHRNAAWMIQHFKSPAGVRPGSQMPPIQLSDPQLNSLAAFLLKLNPDNATALDAAPSFAVEGALVYQTNHCGDCHKVNSAGMAVGPVLNGLDKRRSRSWVEDHFADPPKLSPGSIMPPYKFSPSEMQKLVSYRLCCRSRGGGAGLRPAGTRTHLTKCLEDTGANQDRGVGLLRGGARWRIELRQRAWMYGLTDV